MDGQGIARAALAGISIGGIVSLWVATHAPDRVERLVLANTAAKIGNDVLWKERVRVVREDGLSKLRGRHDDPVVYRAVSPRTTRHRDAVPPDGGAHAPRRLRRLLRRAARCDLRPLAAAVTVPTLVIVGTHDVATTAADGYWLADAIPGARLVELDAAHLSNVERAEAFNDAMRTFLHA